MQKAVAEDERDAPADAAETPPNGSGSRAGERSRIVAAVALIAAVLAAFSDAAPTGTTGWDEILKASAAALFVVAISVSPPWVAIVVATVAATFVGDSVWLGPAALGLLLAIGAGVLPRRNDWMDVVAAGLAVQGLLRLSSIGFFGLPSLIAGAAFALVFFFGYRASGDSIRRVIRRVVIAAIALGAIIGVVGGLVLLSARSDVERGIDAARAGLSAARDGEPEEVVEELEIAAEALTAAENRSSSLLAQPLRLVPVAAQHRQAVTTATRQGSAIARQASRATIEADISSITMTTGSVDLSAMSAMEPDLAKTVELLDAAVHDLDDARSRWLISPVASRMESLTDEMRSVLPEARVAADAARVVPGLLGEDGPRRYFVAFGSPAESRELGGFVGSWALLEFDRGRVDQIDAGRARALYDLARSKPPLSLDEYPRWFVDVAQPATWPQNLTRSPQLSTVAAASRELFDGLGDGPIDGFVYIDGYALGAMLEITGPVTIEDVTGPISAENAENFFFDEQYRLTDRNTLKAELDDIFAELFEGLLDAELPGPERLGRILGPVARQGRLQVATFDDDENAFLESIKLQRRFGPPAETADSFAVVQTNASVSKLDLFLHRDVTYDVTVDEDGALDGVVAVELTSDIPDDAPEYALGGDHPGVNQVRLSLYTRHGLTAVSLDGQPSKVAVVDEFGYWRYELKVELPANTSRTIDFEIEGQIDPERPYDVAIWHQPLVNNDTVHIAHQKVGETQATHDFELVENTVISLDN